MAWSSFEVRLPTPPAALIALLMALDAPPYFIPRGIYLLFFPGFGPESDLTDPPPPPKPLSVREIELDWVERRAPEQNAGEEGAIADFLLRCNRETPDILFGSIGIV